MVGTEAIAAVLPFDCRRQRWRCSEAVERGETMERQLYKHGDGGRGTEIGCRERRR